MFALKLHIIGFLANNKLEVFIILEIRGTMIYRRKAGKDLLYDRYYDA